MRVSLRFLRAAPAAVLSVVLIGAIFFASPFVSTLEASQPAGGATYGPYLASQTIPSAQLLGVETPGVYGFGCVHVVQLGEDLFRIARNYGTTVTALAQANSLVNPALIFAGASLRVPCRPTSPTPYPQPCIRTTYVVQLGEDLFRIGLRYGIDPYTLAAFNNIADPNLIFAGTTIAIPCYSPYNPGNPSAYPIPAPSTYGLPSPLPTPMP
jgi:LysM repeat protein